MSHVTEAGAHAFGADPALIQHFGETALALFAAKDLREWIPYHLGSGTRAAVYALPDYPEFCVKVATPRTDRQETGRPFAYIKPTNLLTDLKVMDQVQRRLASRPEHNVLAPRHLAAVFQQTDMRRYAMLLERVPQDFQRIGTYFKDQGYKATEDKLPETDVLKQRFFKALGATPLRYVVDDFVTGRIGRDRRMANTGNIFIDPAQPAATTPMYVIDLLQNKLSHRPFINRLYARVG